MAGEELQTRKPWVVAGYMLLPIDLMLHTFLECGRVHELLSK